MEEDEEWAERRNVDFLKVAREEAHRTLDKQVQTLDDLDSKAAKILRINLVLLGVILTGLSIASEVSPESGLSSIVDLVNTFTMIGLGLLYLSTVTAGLTYTASSLKSGLSGPNLRDMLWNEYTDKENLEGLIESYSEWIHYNYRVNAKNAPLGTLTVLFLIYALTSLALGVFEAINGDVPPVVLGISVVVLILVTFLSGIVRQLQRYWSIRQ